MVTKGEELVKQMADSSCHIGPLAWDALVKLYVEAGEVEKAESFLLTAVQQNQMKPVVNYHIHYARWGDVHTAEKFFHKMKLSI